MDAAAATKLALECLPALQNKGISTIQSVTSAGARSIQGVWTGSGGITEVTVQGDDGSCRFIAKSIGSYKTVRDELGLQDHWSYYNELSFYETDLPDRMFAAGATCPRPLLVTRSASGPGQSGRKSSRTLSRVQGNLRRLGVISEDGLEEKDEGIICMTKLSGSNWRASTEKTQEALKWLARLHALFWGNARADAAVAAGVSDQACFWHLENRQVEFDNMSPKSPLRLAAAGIDARLKADAMQTMCHGDPKGANIMWDDEQGLSMYDFQWFGKAPPTKDLAYFFATAALNGRGWQKDKEDTYLRYYHAELSRLLEAQGDAPPSYEGFYNTYRLAVVDYGRWIEGGFCWGNMDLIEGHTAEFFKILSDGKPLSSEAEYQERIFACFPL